MEACPNIRKHRLSARSAVAAHDIMRERMPAHSGRPLTMRSPLLRDLLLLLFAAQSVIAGANVAPESQRDIAFWVLREGGRVLLEGGQEYISDPFELPQ